MIAGDDLVTSLINRIYPQSKVSKPTENEGMGKKVKDSLGISRLYEIVLSGKEGEVRHTKVR